VQSEQILKCRTGHGAANVTLGIPRLREIVMTASTKPKTPSMRIAVRPGHSAEEVKRFCKKASRLTLSQVVESVAVTERLIAEQGRRNKVFTIKINFFPEERREQLLMDLSLNIRALISQRLIPREAGAGRIAAMEIMLNSPLIQDLIFRGEVAKIKDIMGRSTRLGMNTFDQALFDLYEKGLISYEDALRNADSKNELRLRVKLESKRENKPIEGDGDLMIVEDEAEGRNL